MTKSREQKKQQTRRAILRAAAELFGKNGYENTSISQLASGAGIGKGTIYGYFSTKKDILNAFFEDELDSIHVELQKKVDPSCSILDQMVALFMTEYDYMMSHPEFGRIYLQECVFPAKDPQFDYKEQENRYFDLIFPLIKNGQSRGELRAELEPLHICGHFYALFLLILHTNYTNFIKPEETEPAMRTLFSQALTGLQPNQ